MRKEKKSKFLRLIMGALLCAILMTPFLQDGIGIHAEESVKMGVVDTSSLNVRSLPSKDGDAIGKLSEGDRITILGIEDGWYEINYDGQTGYVSANYVVISDDFAVEEDESVEEESTSSVDEELQAEINSVKTATSGSLLTYVVLIVSAVIIAVVIIATIKSINNMDDDDYDDEFDDEFDDDDYDDDEYDDYDEDEDYDEYEDYDEDDDYDDDDYEEPVRRRSEQRRRKEEPRRRPVRDEYEEPVRRRPVRDDYREPVKQRAIRDELDPPARKKSSPIDTRYMSNDPDDYRIDVDMSVFDDEPSVKKSNKEADLAAAMKKMEELQAEIERIKHE